MRIRCECFPSEDRTLRFAARELGDYLARMLPDGGELRVDLRAGDDCEAGAVERFRVDLTRQGGEIAGNCPRAALLAVYDLLRRLGCRFPEPGRGSEVVPRIGAEALSLRYTFAARFPHRGVCIEGADSRENVLDFIDWLPKAGYNAFFFQFQLPGAFYERWYRHRLNPRLAPEPFDGDDARALTAEAEAEIARRGLLLHKVGHGWTAAALGYAASSWDEVQPRGEASPLAALVRGERRLFRNIPMDTNLCLSNPEAAARFVELVVEYAGAHPEVDYLHIWLADECNNVCECEACRRTTLSDQYVALLNAIDARLTEAGLGVKLVFLLYQELLWPPLAERLRNPDRFVMMFAPISRSFERSFEGVEGDGDVGALPAYERNRISLPVSLEENLRFLRAWRGMFPGDSFIYDYPLGRAHYGDFGYLHIARLIFEDVGRLRALGLNGYISCQELRAGMPNFLPNYVMGRALMDAGADFGTLAEEYFRALYGDSWRKARDFLAALSECQVCDYVNGKNPRINQAAARRLARAEQICAGFKPSGTGPAWERLVYHAQYVRLFAGTLRALAECDLPRSRREYARFLEFIRETEAQVQPYLDVYRIQEVTGNYTGLRE